jgi:hypothetical protein
MRAIRRSPGTAAAIKRGCPLIECIDDQADGGRRRDCRPSSGYRIEQHQSAEGSPSGTLIDGQTPEQHARQTLWKFARARQLVRIDRYCLEQLRIRRFRWPVQ